MTKFIVETHHPENAWLPVPREFDTQAQAEQFIVDELPDNLPARITRGD